MYRLGITDNFSKNNSSIDLIFFREVTLVVNNNEKCDLLFEQCWMQSFKRDPGVPYTCSSWVVLFGSGGSEHSTEEKMEVI